MPVETRKQKMAALMASFTIREKEAVEALLALRTAVEYVPPADQLAPERPRRACAKYHGKYERS